MIDLTKEEIIESTTTIIDKVKEGELDPIREIAEAQKKVLYYQSLVSELKTHVGDELAKYSEKEKTIFHGVEFKRTSTAAQYDLKSCDEYRVIDDRQKELRKILTTASKSGHAQLVDDVLYEPCKVTKPSMSNISLTIK